MYYKRFIKNSIAQLSSSLVPIMFCFFIGSVVSPELSSIFTLTYPIQFIFMLVTDVLLYSGFTYAQKDKQKWAQDYMLSLVFISFVITFAIVIFTFFLFKHYCNFMHFDLNIFYKWGLLHAIYICTDIAVNAIRLYFIFMKEDKYAGISYLSKVLVVTIPTMVAIFITKNANVSIITYLFFQFVWYVIAIRKIYNPFKFRFSYHCMKYGIPDIVDNLGMLLFFAFGIENIAENSLIFVIAYNLDTLLTDWLWDIKICGIEPIIRSELCSDTFDYKLCKRQYRVSYLCVNILHILLVIGSLFIFNVDKEIFIKCSIISCTYLLVYSFYIVERELLLTHGYERLYGILTFAEYFIRVLIALSPFIWLFISVGLISNLVVLMFTIVIWQKQKNNILNLYKHSNE